LGWNWTFRNDKADRIDFARKLEPTQLTRCAQTHVRRPKIQEQQEDAAIEARAMAAHRALQPKTAPKALPDQTCMMPTPEDEAPIPVSILMRALPDRFEDT
jgi:hypothetical protein